MANTFLTPSVIGREALMILENELVLSNLVHRGHTKEFSGAKKGDTITVRGPASFTAQEFSSSITVQDATETSTSLVLEKHFDVSFSVTAKDLTLELEEFSNQLIRPAVVALAQGLDAYAHEKYVEIPNSVGTAGDPPDSLADLAAVDKKMNDLKIPMGRDRFAVVDSQAKADMMGITAVHQANIRNDGGLALREAHMGRVMGIDWYMSQNVKTHTLGTLSDGTNMACLVNNASVAIGDTTLACDETTLTGTVVIGDTFTVAGDTQQYVITAAATAATNAITLTFTPAAKVAWANNAAVTFVVDGVATDTYVSNLALHRNAMTLAIVPLELPSGATRAQYIGDRNLGIRVVHDYNITTKTDTISLDFLAGAKVQQPELGTRIFG